MDFSERGWEVLPRDIDFLGKRRSKIFLMSSPCWIYWIPLGWEDEVGSLVEYLHFISNLPSTVCLSLRIAL